MRTFFLISGITNTTLRTKLLELKKPKYEEVCEKVNAWAATTSTTKAIEKSQNHEGKANVVKGKGGAKGGAAGKARTPPPANIKIHPRALDGKCFCCGSATHVRENCERLAKAKCTGCNQTGHYKNVCLAEYKAWRNKTFNITATPKKGKGANANKSEAATEEITSAPPSDDEYDSATE